MNQRPDVLEERLVLTADCDPARSLRVRIERLAGPAPAGGRPVAVVAHGFKGFMDWGFLPALGRALAEAGFVAVSFNASGSGIGEDPLVMDDEEAFFHDTFSRQLTDFAQARGFARSLDGVDPGRELLFGHSRGGAMAIIAASEDPPARLVTWAAFSDVDRIDEDAKAAWRRDGVLHVPNGRTGQVHRMSVAALEDAERNRDRLDLLAAAARLDAPWLVVHGEGDATVDVSCGRRLAAAGPRSELLVIDGADHTFGARHPMASDLGAAPDLEVAGAATLAFGVPLIETPGGED